jgi:hypothetical protein
MPLRKPLLHETPETLEAPQSHEVCIPRCLLSIMQDRKAQQQRAHLMA